MDMDEVLDALASAFYAADYDVDPSEFAVESEVKGAYYNRAHIALAVLRSRGALREGPDLSTMLTEAADVLDSIGVSTSHAHQIWFASATWTTPEWVTSVSKSATTPEAAVEAALAAAREAAR